MAAVALAACDLEVTAVPRRGHFLRCPWCLFDRRCVQKLGTRRPVSVGGGGGAPPKSIANVVPCARAGHRRRRFPLGMRVWSVGSGAARAADARQKHHLRIEPAPRFPPRGLASIGRPLIVVRRQRRHHLERHIRRDAASAGEQPGHDEWRRHLARRRSYGDLRKRMAQRLGHEVGGQIAQVRRTSGQQSGPPQVHRGCGLRQHFGSAGCRAGPVLVRAHLAAPLF